MQRAHQTFISRGLLIAGLLASAPTELLAQDDRVIATECCIPLLLTLGARAVSLGSSLTARPGADGVFVNPAALAGLARDEFRIHNAKTDFETTTSFGAAFGVRNAGTLGLTYVLADQGEIPATDEFGNPIGTTRLVDGMLRATFATSLGQGIRTGISYMFYHFNGPGFNATTHGVDFGVQFHPPAWKDLQLGASVVHLGLPLQVINAGQAAPTPARFRGGAAYELMHHFSADTTTALWGSVDVSGSWRQGVPLLVGGGLELILDETIYVRGGYMNGTGRNAGGAVGVGLRYDRFDVGISKSFASEAGGQDPFQITFAIGF